MPEPGDLSGRLRAAAEAGLLRGVPSGPTRLQRLGAGETCAAWLLLSGRLERVVRVPIRPINRMPRPMTAEFEALQRVPPDLGSSAVALETGPGGTGGSGSDNPLGVPYMVTTHVRGRTLSPDDWRPELFAPLAARIARLHLALSAVVGRAGASGGPPPLRPASQEGESLLSWWREHHPQTLLDPRVVPLLDSWRRALERLDPAFDGALTHPLIHGDAVLTNIVVAPDGVPRFIDFEWAGSGDPAKDLALIGGRATGGPWYAPMSRAEILALVTEYAEYVEHVRSARDPRHEIEAGTDAVLDVIPADPQQLLARRDAWELLDRLPNLLYCLSRAETSSRHARWADDLSASLGALLAAGG